MAWWSTSLRSAAAKKLPAALRAAFKSAANRSPFQITQVARPQTKPEAKIKK
jgi:hypothetical protein